MGSSFSFKFLHTDYFEARFLMQKVVEEVHRLEQMLSEFIPSSVTTLLNINAGKKPIKVPEEFYQFVKRCMHYSQISDGAFDITMAGMKQLYTFKNEKVELPSVDSIEAALNNSGYQFIKLLPHNFMFLEKEGMYINFAAVGKGFAADKVKSLLLRFGIKSGLINASGDLCVWGKNAKGEYWKIGIPDPSDSKKIAFEIPLNNLSIATSGDRIQHFYFEGQKYGHGINPKSGLPATDMQSVSVIHPSAEFCDAMATAVHVSGLNQGYQMIEKMPETHAILFDRRGISFTDKIDLYVQS